MKSLTAVPADFAHYGPLHTSDGRRIEILKCRTARDIFICVLRGISDRNAAQALRGTSLFVERGSLPALEANQVYLSDLQNKAVVADGRYLGHIIGFQNFGAGELMELEGGMLIPIAFIDTVSQEVTLKLPQGYLSEE